MGLHCQCNGSDPSSLKADLSLGSLVRHLSGQSEVQAGGLTLASVQQCCVRSSRVAHSMGHNRTNSEGTLKVGKKEEGRRQRLRIGGKPVKCCDLRVFFLLSF